jgi:hypothetical protein
LVSTFKCCWFLLLLQVLAKQAEWAAAGVDDHASSCKDFMQQLAYREYSRCGGCSLQMPVIMLLQLACDYVTA